MYPLNEWGKLRKVIVGIADHANIPEMDISLRTVNYAGESSVEHIVSGSYPQQVIDESNEDLEKFCNFLTSEGVEVVRPSNTPVDYYNYCPRDIVLAHKNLALATPMPLKSRFKNYKHIQHLFDDLSIAPRSYSEENYNTSCISDPNVLALQENQPMFDAANVLRSNNDLLYLVSNSGNKKGAEYLQSIVDSDVNVHLLENVYSYMHIDSTVAFLKEGLLLLNPSRIKDKKILPEPFCNWDAVFAPDPVDLGHYPGICNSSIWTWNVNLFSIRDDLVVLEEHQHNLRHLLEKVGIECAMMPLRHARTLGGCFHCVTLDLKRDET